ncbi:MAG: iron ABC transporter substrate-binding protein [Chloroflexota bacterium]
MYIQRSPIAPRSSHQPRRSRRWLISTAGLLAIGLPTAIAAQEATPEASAVPEAKTPVGTPAPRRGEVTIYSGRSEYLVGPWFTLFDLESCITTDVRYAGTAELAATLLEEGANSPASAFFAQDAGALGLMAQEGLFQPLPQDILDRVPERFRAADGTWVGVTGRGRVLVYNTDLYSDEQFPTSVLDLTDSAGQGKIGWAPENASFQSFITGMRLLIGEDATRSWLQAMIDNGTVNFGDSNAAIVQAVANGEIAAGLVNHYYLFAAQREADGKLPIANHRFAPNDPGSLINVAGIGVLANAPAPEFALEVVAALLDDEAQEYFVEQTGEYALVAGIEAPEDLAPINETPSPSVDLSNLADLHATLELLAEVGLL